MSAKQARLDEGFKHGVSEMNSANRLGQFDWGITGRKSVYENAPTTRNLPAGNISNPIGDNQAKAIAGAIKQLGDSK
ncbi:MAG: hypothetical protein GY799_29895 [Desulfobulbaceae bacterium]|nr:hypothetical protein [Desulfobulbaceae bacterium]